MSTESKVQLRNQVMIDRNLTRQDKAGNHRKNNNKELVADVKTPRMLLIERYYGKKLEEVLCWPLSNRKLAEKISLDTASPITGKTVCVWRQQFNIIRRRVR